MPRLVETIGPTQRLVQGLFLDWPVDLIPEGGCADGQNVEFDSGGSAKSVPGYTKFVSGAVPGTGPVMMIAEWIRSDGTRRTMACSRTALGMQNADAFDNLGGALTGGVTDHIFGAGVRLNLGGGDRFIFTNGVDAVKITDGVTVSNSAAPVDRALGLTVFEGCTFIWNLRVSGVDYPLRIRWTSRYNGDTWSYGESGYLDIEAGGRNPLLAAAPMRDQLLLYKENLGGVHAVTYHGAPIYFGAREVIPQFGVFSPRGVATFRDVHYVLATDEQIYAVASGATPEPIGDPVRKRLFKNLNWANKKAAWVAVYPFGQTVAFAVPEGAATSPSRAYLYNYKTGAWGERELQAASATVITNPWAGSGVNANQDVLLFGGVASTAYAYYYGWGTTADGAAIESYLTTRRIGRGGRRQTRLRGVELDIKSGAPSVEVGAAASLSGNIVYTPTVGSDPAGRYDANVAAEYLAVKIRGSKPWEVTGYRLDGYPHGGR